MAAPGNITITGTASANGKFNSADQPEDGGGGEGVIFTDDFSSGDLNKQHNGAAFWTGVTNLGVISGFSRAGYTGNCVRFNFNIAAEAVSELRYNLGSQYSELYFRFYLYYPSGSESPTLGPRVALTGNNNKFFRVWADAPDGAANGEDPKFGASYYAASPSGDVRLGAQAGVFPVGAPGSVSQVPTETPIYTPLITDSTRGTWIKFKIRVKAGTEAGHPNAEYQCWINDVERWNITGLDAYSPGGVYTGMRKGYIMGAQDAQWQNSGTYIYMDDFAVSTEDDI